MPNDPEGDITQTPSLAEYAGKMLKQRLTRMLSHSDGVREGIATEPVHQMRVWSRRTRAALDLYKTCYDGLNLSEMEHEIKRVADALGEARDLDVMIEKMTVMGESLPERQRRGVSSFVDTLVQDRSACQSAVDRAVARLQRFDLQAVLEEVIAVPEPHGAVTVEFAGRVS